jgi:hypothetical protein
MRLSALLSRGSANAQVCQQHAEAEWAVNSLLACVPNQKGGV